MKPDPPERRPTDEMLQTDAKLFPDGFTAGLGKCNRGDGIPKVAVWAGMPIPVARTG